MASKILLFNSVSFTPPTANLTAHYDASIASSVHVSTGVSQWDDLSGNNFHLLQASGTKQPAYSGSGTSSTITFDGSNDDLRAVFTFNQPETVYIVVKTITWTLNKYITDGSAVDKMDIYFETSTPNIALYAGTTVGNNSGLTVGAFKVVTAVFNGASSSLSVNDNTKITGNVGAANAGGFTIGSAGNEAGQFANIAVSEVYLYSAAHSAATQTSMITYLRSKWGI